MKVYTLVELLALQEDLERWIIPNIIPSPGRVLLYGPPGIGKSLLALDLALGVALGDDWMGLAPVTKPGAVLVASTEGDLYSNRDRVQWLCNAHALTAGYEHVPFFFAQEPVLLDTNEGQQQLNEHVERIRPRLLILDPLDSFFAGEENSATATKPLRRCLDWMIRTYGLTVLLLHHESKDEKGARGSSALPGWADAILRARGLPGSALSLDVEKQRNGRRGHLARVALHVEPRRGLIRFTSLDTSPDDGATREGIVDLLIGQGPQTVQGLKAILKRSGATLYRTLDDLERLGRVERCPLQEQGPQGLRVVEGWRSVGGVPAGGPPDPNQLN